MRITQQVMVGNILKHLQQNTGRLDKTYQRLATGKKYQRASEAPIKVINSMQYNDLITDCEQYQRNLDQALNWLNFSESAIDDAIDVIGRARDLALYSSNETQTQEELDNINEEVEELYEQLIDIANSRMGDHYIFSGQAISTVPFDDTGNYQGDYNNIKREISPGIKVVINTNGDQVFSSILTAIDNLRNNLASGNTDAISNTTIGELDVALDNSLSYRAQIGAKVNRLELTRSRLDDEILSLKKQLSQVEDVDLAEEITELKMQESVYRSALGVGARIMQPTLLDFLR